MTCNQWNADSAEDQRGRAAIVTGATGGIGLETAEVCLNGCDSDDPVLQNRQIHAIGGASDL